MSLSKSERRYRKAQLKKVDNGDYIYSPSIQLTGAQSGATFHIGLSKQEYKAIVTLLLKGV